MDKTYNGWNNYQTWNVALWINNDGFLQDLAKDSENYLHFQKAIREQQDFVEGRQLPLAFETPDNVAWNDSGLDIEALDRVIADCKN